MLKSFLIAALLLGPAPARAAEAEPKDTDLIIVFDTSGSMSDSVPGGRKLDIAKAAMWKFVDSLPRNVHVGLVAFNGHCGVRVVEPLRKGTPEARAALRASMASLRADGSTPIGDALALASKLLASSKNKRRIVVMTDGEETCAESRLGTASDAAWKDGIKVYAIGFAFGQEPSRNFRRIGIYKDANDDKQLASVFTDIRKSLEKETGKFDESKGADPDRPSPSLAGRKGHFRPGGSERAGRLYQTLQLNSSFEHRFGEADRFTVLEHGYHVLFDEAEFRADRVEVLRVKLEDKLNFPYGGVEGFVFVNDAVIE